MIDKCFNPACGRVLRYLRDGRVVRVIRRTEEPLSIEHYWLCGSCCSVYELIFPEDGTIAIQPKLRRRSEALNAKDALVTSRAS